jgi:hypothetical protein
MPETETELEKLRRAAREWAGWEPWLAEAEEKQVLESAGSTGDGEKQ